ncbi:hypothetical protein BH10CYA1_BH10CYA1_29910 [soil metagenome]
MPPSATQDVPSLFKERTLPGNGPRKSMSAAAMLMLVLMVVLVGVGISKMVMNKPVVKDTVVVVGAGSDLPAGARIVFGSLHYVEIPKRYATPEMLLSSEQAVGKLTKYFIPMGEPISSDELFAQKNSLSSNLETHEVALSLKLDDEAMVDHNIACGDNVDVLAVMTKEGKRFTKTVCQDVRVLLANSKAALESKSLRSTDQSRLTLAVTPQQAELITEAAESGKIRLNLRSRLSRRVNHLAGVAEEDLMPASATVSKKIEPLKMPSLPNMFIPAPPAMPTSPLPPLSVQSLAVPAPLEWVVEVFSGSHKEACAVPLSTK